MDHHYRFFHCIQSQLGIDEIDRTLEEIQRNLIDFNGTYTRKELCRDWTIQSSNQGLLELDPDHVESDWGRDYQVDVVGVNAVKKHLILGECMWTSERGCVKIFQELVEKKTARVVPASGDWVVFFLGFAREGWNEDAVEFARDIKYVVQGGTNWQILGMRLLILDDVDSDLF